MGVSLPTGYMCNVALPVVALVLVRIFVTHSTLIYTHDTFCVIRRTVCLRTDDRTLVRVSSGLYDAAAVQGVAIGAFHETNEF